jgi:hypothetical protein
MCRKAVFILPGQKYRRGGLKRSSRKSQIFLKLQKKQKFHGNSVIRQWVFEGGSIGEEASRKEKGPGEYPSPSNWWSWRELNPRPQALCRWSYMLSQSIKFNWL